MSVVTWRFAFPVVGLAAVLALGGCGSSSSTAANATPTSAKPATSASHLALMAPGYLTVGSDTTYPPMEYPDPNNPSTYVGTDVDLADAIAKSMGLKGAHVVKGSFDALIPSLQAKRYDVVMSSLNDTPARAKLVTFVDYMTASEAILVKKGSPIHADSYASLCGKTVSVQRGTTEQDGLTAANAKCTSKINIQIYQADTDAFQAFAAGHTDAYTSDLPVIANYAAKAKGKYVLAGKAITAGENYGIAIRKGEPKLTAAIRAGLSHIRADGQYTRILKKWGVADAAMR